jgi:anaerobic selenocysteine-containing dehydrogenase
MLGPQSRPRIERFGRFYGEERGACCLLLETQVEGAVPQWGRTQCPYCGVGCGLLVQIEDGKAARVKGDPDHPANFGEVCARAVMLPRTLDTPDRLLYPYLRLRRNRGQTHVPWSSALSTIARSFRSIITQHSPDAVAFYGSGQLLTEDYRIIMLPANQSWMHSIGPRWPPCGRSLWSTCRPRPATRR